MLAAIVQRESGGQNIFQEGIPAGPGCGVGLCQITYGVNWADPSFPLYNGENLLDPLANLRIAASVFLEPALEQFPFNHIAAFAAYNLGIGGVQEEIAQGLDPDALTTGNDYGHDVFANWINFVAASCGYTVDWSTWKDMNLLPSTQRIPATATP
jgi:hypothetical protein